jgi:TonB family protein
MARIVFFALLWLVAGCATVSPAPVGPEALKRAAFRGNARPISFWYYVTPDCTSPAIPRLRIVKPPAHGAFTFSEAMRLPNFAPSSYLADCNKRPVPVTLITYKSDREFVGTDTAVVDVLFFDGSSRRAEFAIEVADLPKKISGANPTYPEAARTGELEGEVVAWVHVNADGDVTRVEIRKTPGEALSREVADTMRKWKFQAPDVPSTLYPFVGEFSVIFRLLDREPSVRR